MLDERSKKKAVRVGCFSVLRLGRGMGKQVKSVCSLEMLMSEGCETKQKA